MSTLNTNNPNQQHGMRYGSHPSLLTANFALIAFLFLQSLVSGGFSLLVDILNISETSLLYRFLSSASIQLLCLLPCAMIFTISGRRRPAAVLRLRRNINIIQVLFLCVIGFALIYLANGLNNLLLLWLESMGYVPMSFSTYEPDNIPGLAVCLISTAVMPAICEEFFFRGEIMRSYERLGPGAAVVVSAILFGLMHGNIEQVFFAFICGLVLGTCVMTTGSIWAGVVVHFFNNAYSLIISYVTRNTPIQTITTEDYIYSNIIYILFGAVLLTIAGIGFIRYTRYRNHHTTGSALPDELDPDYSPLDESMDFRTGQFFPTNAAGRNSGAAYVLLTAFVLIEAVGITILTLYQMGAVTWLT